MRPDPDHSLKGTREREKEGRKYCLVGATAVVICRRGKGGEEIKCTDREKDLGVAIQDNLSPEGHINKIVGEGLALVANARSTFAHIDETLAIKVIQSILRPKLEYAQVVWAPHLKKHMKKLERFTERGEMSRMKGDTQMTCCKVYRGRRDVENEGRHTDDMS